MNITYLGHAGFCVETRKSIIIMDPWLSKDGAFDAAWFQYPKNHHMSHYVQTMLSSSTKDKYIYISHEHQDHFDLTFLKSLETLDFTIILANFTHPIVKKKLDDISYRCKDIILLNNQEKFILQDGFLVLFMIDDELNCDSAILVKTDDHSFLNLNDCKLHDKLHEISEQYQTIDVFTAQFSGASWYPTCYQMSPEKSRIAGLEKTYSKFKATVKAIQTIKPKIYLPSAGPPCFLDPLLIEINFQENNSYPRAPELLSYLNQHCDTHQQSTKCEQIWPGSRLNVETLQWTHPLPHSKQHSDFKGEIMSYAKEYEDMFSMRRSNNEKIDPHQVFVDLKVALIKKINALKLVHDSVTTLLYWSISDYPNKMYCIDLAKKTIRATSSIRNQNNYFKITSPAWQVNKVLIQEISWPEFALTFRVQNGKNSRRVRYHFARISYLRCR